MPSTSFTIVTVFSSFVKSEEIYSCRVPRIMRIIRVTKMLKTIVSREYFLA